MPFDQYFRLGIGWNGIWKAISLSCRDIDPLAILGFGNRRVIEHSFKCISGGKISAASLDPIRRRIGLTEQAEILPKDRWVNTKDHEIIFWMIPQHPSKHRPLIARDGQAVRVRVPVVAIGVAGKGHDIVPLFKLVAGQKTVGKNTRQIFFECEMQEVLDTAIKHNFSDVVRSQHDQETRSRKRASANKVTHPSPLVLHQDGGRGCRISRRLSRRSAP